MTTEAHLDGNAVGGLLREVFGREMTAARACCDGCGAIAPLGALLAFTRTPGEVLRCPGCQAVLMVAVVSGSHRRVSFDALRWVELELDPNQVVPGS